MADTRKYLPDHPLDIEQILQEARNRWLRPTEILEILSNFQRFNLTPEPPLKPPAGSLFLFDRKALRYFRKDGHRWRKKKDGKTVREAHEKLKSGSVDVLHCYYAHGEDNENFQRRCYWMLDEKLEHIVLVHYREVKEGYKSGISRLLVDPGIQVDNLQPSSTPSFVQTASPTTTAQAPLASNSNRIEWNGQSLSSESEDVDSRNGQGISAFAQLVDGLPQRSSLLTSAVEGFPLLPRNYPGQWFIGAKSEHGTQWPEICSSTSSVHGVNDQKFYDNQPDGTGFATHKPKDAVLNGDILIPDTLVRADRFMNDVTTTSQRIIQKRDFNWIPFQFHDHFGSQTEAPSTTQVKNEAKDGCVTTIESGELKKLDSFGRWMDKEIGVDCDDSFMASDSGNYWNSIGGENDEKEVSSLSHHMHLDIDSLGPSLSQDQLFSISDFSPDWAYSGVETKVLIVGAFLGCKTYSDSKWGCMFGEIEVPAEVLTDNVIRCQAPSHASGHVPFYVTRRNRLACSEVREFEYREYPSGIISPVVRSNQEEELQFQMRLAKLLHLDLGMEMEWLNCCLDGCEGCRLRKTLSSIRNRERDLKSVRENCVVSERVDMDPRDELIQSLLKDRLCDWLVYKVHDGGKGPDVLDDRGQGVIHLAAALGYEWAMGFIVAASGNPNFRDARGRTALHWASYFGREETVVALIRLGVDPTAVDDPTPACPGGQSAADLASSQGHKGIAGYLAEAFLTRHLSLLNIKQADMDRDDASIVTDKANEVAGQVSVTSNEGGHEQFSLKGSLAAVRKSAHAAALIQEAYRAKSFKHRQLSGSRNDISEVSVDLAALGCFNSVQKRSHFEDYLHSAAVKIQQKYRGWKGRKDFLKIRNRIVKIQAHVRGHQVRKQYKKVVWSVGIVEKAILRWRRKRPGLRGFQSKKAAGNAMPEAEKSDEYEFLRVSRKQKIAGVEKALARVTSMFRNPEARDQYMRLVTKFENLQMGDGGSGLSQQGESSQ